MKISKVEIISENNLTIIKVNGEELKGVKNIKFEHKEPLEEPTLSLELDIIPKECKL